MQVEFFYEGAPQLDPAGVGPPSGDGLAEQPTPTYVSDFLSTADGLHLMRAFVRVKDAKVRKRIVDLVEALTSDDEAA